MVKRMSALGYHLIALTKFIRTHSNSKKIQGNIEFCFHISYSACKTFTISFFLLLFAQVFTRMYKMIWIFAWLTFIQIFNMNRDRQVHWYVTFRKFSWTANKIKNYIETLTIDGKWNMHSNVELSKNVKN